MIADGAACISLKNLFELSKFLNECSYRCDGLCGAEAICNENAGIINIIAANEAILYVAFGGLIEAAAVLLANAHLAVFYLNAGLKRKHICTKGNNSGAASTLMQIFQSIYDEACLYLRSLLVKLSLNFSRLHSGLGHFCGSKCDKTTAGGKVS